MTFRLPFALLLPPLLLSPLQTSVADDGDKDRYDAEYRVQLRPEAGVIDVELRLSGEKLPSRIVLSIDPARHREFSSTDALKVEGDEATWRPQGNFSRLRWQFVVNHQRSRGGYDSYMTDDWTLFRADKLIPRASVRARRGLKSRASFDVAAPPGWSLATPYAPSGELRFEFDDPQRRFDRPRGWMLAGRIGVRSEKIDGVQTIVAAPEGDRARRQDTLAFLNWNLPPLLKIFSNFPGRVLIVQADDPMWRGGLSGPASMFLHSDRPLISENRTSTLLHELVHIAMGIHADGESDWIVEGLAEYYSIEALRRSGTISEGRYQDALKRLRSWSKRAPTLFTEDSSGAVTARAVLALQQVDAELRAASGGKANLDDVARQLAEQRGEVSLALVQNMAEKIAGRPLRSLQREQLMHGAGAAPAR